MKTANDVIQEWIKRGYVTSEQAQSNKDMYESYITQAKDSILSFCNIPLAANMPDGLFYPWVEIGYSFSQGGNMTSGGMAVKSISEGDTSITYGSAESGSVEGSSAVDYTSILNRFRRLP